MGTNTTKAISRPAVIEAQDTITRPADTTQYAAGDALSDNATTPTAAGYFTLPLASIPGSGGMIFEATLHKSDQDQTSADLDVLLFDTLPALAGFEDNATIAITDAEMQNCKGVLSFAADSWTNVGTGDVQTVNKNIGYVCTASETNLYGIVAVQGTYTPGNAEVFALTVKAYAD